MIVIPQEIDEYHAFLSASLLAQVVEDGIPEPLPLPAGVISAIKRLAS